MKNFGVFLAGLLLVFLVNSENVSAVSGVSPGSYEIDFKPFLDEEFEFYFIFDEGVNSVVYADGDLADYVFLDKTEISGSEMVIARVRLPEKINNYGINTLVIGAKQDSGNSRGVGLVSNVKGQINVFVPYPGKNVRAEVYASNKNVGELLETKIKIFNEGDEGVLVRPSVYIFKDGEEVANLDFDERQIEPLNFFEEIKTIDSSELKFGDYGVVAMVDYGEEHLARAESFFKLGKLFINITGHPEVINKSKLEKFEIEIESFYNDEIEDVYGKVSVGEETFISPVTKMGAWEKKKITVYIDSSDFGEGEIPALITIFYGNESSSRMISLDSVASHKRTYIVAIIVLFFIVLFFIFWKRL